MGWPRRLRIPLNNAGSLHQLDWKAARAWVCDPDMQGLTNALPCDRDIASDMGHRGVLCKAVHIVPAWSELDWHLASSMGQHLRQYLRLPPALKSDHCRKLHHR